ncbi:aminopeptidase N-like [Armigeres subalbatus]|uniref:aminopeptidase N-like n=1 Tax=Armigeres subalbatus TaxID=124917 RepID=UPI002ED5D559
MNIKRDCETLYNLFIYRPLKLQYASSVLGFIMLLTALVISFLLITHGSSSVLNIIPKQYNVQFETDIGSDNYNGTVWIDLEVLLPVEQFELQARNLTIEDVSLNSGELVYPTKFRRFANATMQLSLNELLPTGTYQLKITFTGSMSEYDVMFKGSYQRDDNSTSYYLMSKPRKSHFNEAPSAFPHLGEELKATFKISVAHYEKLHAWSNMPLQKPPKPHDRENYVVSCFQVTPKMHVYDVGFIVAEFDSKKFGNLTVVAREDILQYTQYVGYLGNELVRIMDEHAATDYSGPIPDFVYIVLPRDLGLHNLTEFERMFVQEEYMVFNKEKHDFNRLYKVLERSSYRLMLQWFGNLIAPEEERLHQAFSNVYTYFNAEKVYPEEFIMLAYQIDVLQGSLLDNHESSSCVLNMFWLMVLDEKWRVVMRKLMKNRKPRTLTTAQLCLEAQTSWPEDYNLPEGTSLESIFNQWMYSDAAPPVLNVQRLYSEGNAILSQNGLVKVLPYNYATEYSHFNQLGPFQWLVGQNATVQFGGSDDHWLILNKEEFGYYRVNYDESNWQLISGALKSNASGIHRLSRMHLLDDALYFVKNDQLNATIFLDLITYLRGETFYVAWYNAFNILTSGYYPEIDPPNLIKNFLLHLIDPYYQKYVTQNYSKSTPQMELYIHSKIAALACWLDKEDCLQHARSTFQLAVANDAAVEPNWSPTIYCYGLRNASDEELEWLLTKQAEDLSQSIEYLRCVNSKKHLRRVLEELAEQDDFTTITHFVRLLDETGFQMLHALLESDAALVQLLEKSTIELSLLYLSRITKSAKTLALIDDLEQKLELDIAEKGQGSTEGNIWTKPGVVDYIERYMQEFKK